METILCPSFKAKSICNSTEFEQEQCESTLSKENCLEGDEWEDDFRLIEEAELSGNVYKIENIEEYFPSVIENNSYQINQAIKEEPELDIEPDKKIIENGNSNAERYPYVCNECKMCFKRKASLTAHINAEHCLNDLDSDSIEKNIRESTKPPKNVLPEYQNYFCKDEQNIFKSSYDHKKYQPTQHIAPLGIGSSILKCNHCNFSFPNEHKLKTHANQCINNEKYFCGTCKIFVSCSNALKKHKKSKQHLTNQKTEVFDGEGKFVCGFCGERFRHQIILTNHKKNHTEEFKLLEEKILIEKQKGCRSKYICKLCGKQSGNKSHVEEHIQVHTKEKPNKCGLCGSRFTTRSSLTMHLLLHSDDRPFKCHICETTYRHRKSLKIHLIKHSGENPFKCKYCDKTFARRWTMEDHERLLHTGETPYRCELCGECFKTSWYLNSHRREQHNIDTNRKQKVAKLVNNTASNEK